MAYGIELLNTDGVPVFDTNHQTLRQVASGTTVSYSSALSEVEEQYMAIPTHYKRISGLRSQFNSWAPELHIAGPGLQLIDAGFLPPPNQQFRHYIVAPQFAPGTNGGWSAFYQFNGTPIWFSVEVEFDSEPQLFPQGTFPVVNSQRPYRLTAPIPTPGGYVETYGMQVFNAAGDVVFDSRDTFLAVRFAFIVPQAVVENVLFNGATKTVTLPEAMPNCWISIPRLHCPNRIFISQNTIPPLGINTVYRYDRVQIEQVSATQLLVSRRIGEEFQETRPMNTPPYTYSYVHDIVVYLARNV
jgi:hypothetical protein